MCGRYTRHYTWAQVRAFLDILFEMAEEMPPSYNVAPTQIVPICRLNENGQRELAAVKWGFIPSWQRGKPSATPINARSETATESRVFRSAFKSRRCIVPASGFYEWKTTATGKQPMYITRADHSIMLMAGLWDRWNGEDGTTPTDTMTILTTQPNAFMSCIHDRMPVLLEPQMAGDWLECNTSTTSIISLLSSSADGILTAHPVSTRVNSPRNNDAGLCEPTNHFTLFE